MGLFLINSSAWATESFTAELKDVKAGEIMPMKYVGNHRDCKGENKSPEISWKNAPAGTKSFAVTMYDPDAPTGSGWWHWLVFNIPANVQKLPENFGSTKLEIDSLKPAIQSSNDARSIGYRGACPPIGHGDHRYIFTVFALKVDKIDLKPDASGAMVGRELNINQLAKSQVEIKYGRK